MCNHELNLGDAPPVDAARLRPYDARVAGGTTTPWVDAERKLVKSFASLSSTVRNCAGGSTPWNSWLSAEETTLIPGPKHPIDADVALGVNERHGYIFEVDARSESLAEPVARGARPSALGVGDYARGDVLEALRVKARPRAVKNNQESAPVIALGQTPEVDWIRIPEVDPDMNMERPSGDLEHPRTASSSTRAQGLAIGCGALARTEEIAHDRGSVYFCCTNGGPSKLGQVFRLELRRQRLSLVVEPDDHALFDGPDNLCVAPQGDPVVCEDNLAQRENFVADVSPFGSCYRLARNAHRGQREFAGAGFSPDESTLFMNVQSPGMTFAIWGAWERRRG